MSKLCLLVLLSGILVFSQATVAEEKDPFAPYVTVTSDGNAVPAQQQQAAPVRTFSSNIIELDRYPLNTYKLIGIIVSPDKSFGILRSNDAQDYFVKVGDVVGSEKGVVDKISVESLVVKVGDNNTVTLTVNNKLVEGDGGGNKAVR